MSNSGNALITEQTVFQECLDCGHVIESVVLNAPIAYEAKAGGCEEWCLFVSKVGDDWLIDPAEVRQLAAE